MRKMWNNRKTLLLLLVVECLLLLVLLPGLWKKQITYTVSDAAMQGNITEEVSAELPELKSGIYEITMEYQAAEGSSTVVSVTNDNDIYKGSYSNDISLKSGETVKTMTVWLTAASEAVTLKLSPSENAALVVNNIQVTRTNAGAAVAIVCLLLLSLVLDGYCLYGYALQGRPDAKERKVIAGGLFGILMVAALPIFTDYCLNGTELTFHLLRIEGLKDGLLSGQFPVRIQPNWLNGQGYAVSIFEGDLFLLIPALLRMVGFPVQTAYRIYLLLVNIVTVAIAYTCFKGMFKDRVIGLVGSMLYVWMPYRLDAMYGNADLGEATALCFLPMVFYGFYRILINDTNTKSCKRVWILPAVGLSCMFQSHVTTFLLAAVMIFSFCLLRWKRVFTKSGLLAIGKTIVAVIVLSAWMLIPMLDCLLNGNLLIKYAGAMPIQSKGGTLMHYLWTFYTDGRSRDFGDNLLINTAPLGIGFAVTCLVFLFVWILFTGRYQEQRKESAVWKTASASVIAGGILLFMSTSVFPWNTLRSNRIIQLLTAGLKSPMELVPMVGICLIFAGCAVLWQIRQKENASVSVWVLAAVVAVALVTTQFLTGDIVSSRQAVRIYDGAALDTTQILGGEYLPMGSDAQTGYFLENASGERDAVVELLENDLHPNWYWRVSEVISLGGLLGLCCYQIVAVKKNRGNEDGYVEKI